MLAGIRAITQWAHEEGHQSACILVFIPGAKEMAQIRAAWEIAKTREEKDSYCEYHIDSSSSETLRCAMREHLRQQNFKLENFKGRKEKDIVVFSQDALSSSITLFVNGVIDTNESIHIDENDFLVLGACTDDETEQRRGRGGRKVLTMWLNLKSKNFEKEIHIDVYKMPKDDALSSITLMVRLRECFELISISGDRRKNLLQELEDLAVISRSCEARDVSGYILTSFGKSVVANTMNVRYGLVEAVAERLGVGWHASIAIACLQTTTDIFVRKNIAPDCGLLPSQIALDEDVPLMYK